MTLRPLLSIAAIFSIALSLPAVSSAAIIFTNFGPSFTYDTANFDVVGNAFDGNNYAEGDTFTPSSTAQFFSLNIALSCFAVCPNSFLVALNQDSGSDSPGAAIETFTIAGTLLQPAGTNNPPLVLNSVLLPTLTAGTQFWITVQSDTSDSIGWANNITGDLSDEAISTDGGATYFSPSFLTPGAYQVNSANATATPEPGTWILLTATLPLLLRFRRRRT